MHLLDIARRTPVPAPWLEGEKIPWHDPDFSRRMLREHLSQEHDRASRRSTVIEAHVEWMHTAVLHGRPSRVLDLACGPGLYTSRLAQRGHECVGFDFAPASIEHARAEAEQADLRCTYILDDIRDAEYGEGFSLAMLISGELNVFRRSDAQHILRKAREALTDGGQLLLEVHTFDALRERSGAPRSWIAAENGLFSDRPHLRLDESFWDGEQRVATRRYIVVDAATAEVSWYAESLQAYTDADYRSMLNDCGFTVTATSPSLAPSQESHEFVVFLASA